MQVAAGDVGLADAAPAGDAGLGRDHHLVAGHHVTHEGGDQLLGRAVAVAGGRVEQGAAGLGEGDQLVAGLVLVGVAAPHEGAEAEPGHLQAGVPHGALLHGQNRSRRVARSWWTSSKPSSSEPFRGSPSSCRSPAAPTSGSSRRCSAGATRAPRSPRSSRSAPSSPCSLYFRKDIWRIGSAWTRSLFRPEYRGHLDARMGWFIIIGSLPIVVLGIAAEGRHRAGLPQPLDHRHDPDRARHHPRRSPTGSAPVTSGSRTCRCATRS